MSTGVSVTASCPARAALAGNPSDGHGGAVVAAVIPSISATVSVVPAERFQVAGVDLECRSVAALDERADEFGALAQSLVPAALVAIHRHLGADVDPVAIDVATTIPRSVGLAGSSAIVIAVIRAVVERHPDRRWASRLAADPALLASVALAAEREVLGIAAGLQDRVAQSFGSTMAMEFGGRHRRTLAGLDAGTYRRLGPLPSNLFVACRPDAATDSGLVHAATDPSAPAVVAAMRRCADAARTAAIAIDGGDRVSLGAAIDATFEARASVMELHTAHLEMVELARLHGCAANYTGSGGAIVVLPPDDATTERRVRGALVDELGCELFELGGT